MVRADGAASTAGVLLSPAGRRLLARLGGEDVSGDRALTLSAALRGEYPADLIAAALTQQALRTAAAAKFGDAAGQMLFTRAGLEQASSQLTARHAAARFAGASLIADLCCGIGGNLAVLASAGSDGTAGTHCRVVGIDADLTHLAFARHNVSVRASGAEVGFVCADVAELRLSGFDAVFIDPARRDGQRRLPAGKYLPPIEWCLRLAEVVPRVGIKAAPGIRLDLMPVGWEVEFVAVGRSLKEALLWSPAMASGTARRATVLPAGDTLASPADSGSSPQARPDRPAKPDRLDQLARLAPPGAYLLDPNPAITRAGLVIDLAQSLGAWQIDPRIAFLSSDDPVRTPFARTLRVLESAPWHEKRFARRLRELGIGSADIRRRGLAGDVAQIHRRLDLRGAGAATIVLTRVDDRPWGLICVPATD